VWLKDAGGNVVLNHSAALAVTATLASPNGTLLGDATASFVLGVAVFSDLAVDFAQPAAQLRFTAPGVPRPDVLSQPFAVETGPAAALRVARQPADAEGGVINVQPWVEILDAGGNKVLTPAPY